MFDRKLSSRVCRFTRLLARALSCALLLASVACAGSARAEASGPDEAQAYQQSVREALRALHAGNWAEAHAQFSRAHELRPSARTLRGLGIAELELGEHVASYQHLSQALSDPRRPLPAPQRKQVQDTLARIASMIGRYRIELTPREATWTVDGAAAQLDAEGNALLTPGEHTIVVEAPNHEPHTHALTVRGGEQAVLVFRLAELAPTPPAEPAAEPPRASAAPLSAAPDDASAVLTSEARAREGSRSVWPWATLGSGCALGVLGTVLAARGLRDFSYAEEPPDGVLLSELQASRDRAPVLTSVGFTLAGVGLAGVGIGLWGLLRRDLGEPRVALVIAPRGLELKGTY